MWTALKILTRQTVQHRTEIVKEQKRSALARIQPHNHNDRRVVWFKCENSVGKPFWKRTDDSTQAVNCREVATIAVCSTENPCLQPQLLFVYVFIGNSTVVHITEQNCIVPEKLPIRSYETFQLSLYSIFSCQKHYPLSLIWGVVVLVVQ